MNVVMSLSYTMHCKETRDCSAFQSLMHISSFFFSCAAGNPFTIPECDTFNTLNHIWNHCVQIQVLHFMRHILKNYLVSAYLVGAGRCSKC